MTLNEFLARAKREALEEINDGRVPSQGRCDEPRLRDLQAKGKAQIGTAVLGPQSVTLEFLFNLAEGQSEVLTLAIVPPERIVYLPVPEWVVESVWQGEVQGSHHFESHANELLAKFRAQLGVEENGKWFERQPPKRRE